MTTNPPGYAKAYHLANHEKIKAQKRAYYHRNKERLQARDREKYAAMSAERRASKLAGIKAWQEANPTKVLGYRTAYRARRGTVDGHRQNRYNLGPDEYRDALVGQAGLCGICGRMPERLVVDHDHDKGTFRALLCHHCNVMLGCAKDDSMVLAKAIEYLAAFR